MFSNRLLCVTVWISFVMLNASAQTTVTAGSVNGVLNPTQFSGSDIGAKVNTAWKSGATVRIPAGTYSFATTIVHPGTGYKLECDTGATLNYTGSGDAIELAPANPGSNQNAGIDGDGGCLLKGTSSAQSGIHIYPSNHTFVRNIRITGFTNGNSGYGIYVTGGNSLEINNVSSYLNRTGVYLTGSSQYSGNSANAVHISDSDISTNSNIGIDSENSHCGCTANFGNSITNNVIENNGNIAVQLNWDVGTTVIGNYISGSSTGINVGPNENEFGITIRSNYFEAMGTPVVIGYGSRFTVAENNFDNTGAASSTCFVNVDPGPNGSTGYITGVGTNFKGLTLNEFCNLGVKTTTPIGPFSTSFSLDYQ
jgi:hypothetical protein